jgi:hypothetical protein
MPTGRHIPSKPAKRRHMSNFDKAMKQALQGWKASDGKDQDHRVVFEVTVSPNPGGIKEYRVTITEGP